MRIAILEWVCGGGMHAIAPDQIPTSLANEGQAMLACLLRQFSAAGADVVTLIDSRLVNRNRVCQDRCQLVDYERRSNDSNQTSDDVDPVGDTIQHWIEFAFQCDLVLVVAPEIDGILQRCLRAMKAAGLALLNCSGSFLENCCSKFQTARVLHQADIEHPKTYSLEELQNVALTNDEQLWCIKSDLGAGCEGLQVGTLDEIRAVASAKMLSSKSTSDTSYIVQPWIEGQTFSCSAIVDRTGTAHWFPLVTQSFSVAPSDSGCTTRIYQGGEIVLNSSAISRPTELLNRTIEALAQLQPLGALGWIGVDLLLDKSGKWIVIEVNPRMTTSVIGLSEASPKNLGELMMQAFQGKSLPPWSDSDWKKNVAFNATGTVDTI
ncbi:MAG: ATP-grasp domain-containing protein [Pirellulales bacterium]